MVPIPDFNYETPKKIDYKSKVPKAKKAKNIGMEAESRYGKEKNKLKKGYVDLRSKP